MRGGACVTRRALWRGEPSLEDTRIRDRRHGSPSPAGLGGQSGLGPRRPPGPLLTWIPAGISEHPFDALDPKIQPRSSV
jgi:hypothetical protein